MPVIVTPVVPQPRIDLRSADGETGAPVRVTTYRGVAILEFQKEGAFSVTTASQANPITVVVPAAAD